MRASYIIFLTTKKKYLLLIIIEAILFSIYYYVLSPSNFEAFSNTLRNYLSAIGTLLAVVVSFNTFTIQNQLKNMPKNLKRLNKQLDNIQSLLEPVFIEKQKQEKDEEKRNEKEHGKNNSFEKAHLFYSDALKSTIDIIKDKAKFFIDNRESYTDDEFKKDCESIYQECNLNLSKYDKNKNIYNLLILSTTKYIQNFKFKDHIKNSDEKKFFELFQKLHILKSICYRIYIRNILTSLTFDILASSVPIITLIGLIASISDYKQYNSFMLRIAFAMTLSIAAIPFLLLFIRIIPILYLIKDASTIPFIRKQ